ncbi:MAG: pro-sigmaK processing inhibitor BofA family protein [Clostridia bacterium]
MDNTNTIIIFLSCILAILIFGKILILPVKQILKLVFNSILGGALILIINWIGAMFNFHIGLNIFTSVFVGILGIPGAILLAIFKLILF